jgi:hypothetical protein
LEQACVEHGVSYLLQEAADIESILRELERQNSPLSMRLLSGGEALVTRLVAVALAHDIFIHAGDADGYGALYTPGDLLCFDGALDGAGVRFVASVAGSGMSPWPQALAASIPTCIAYFPQQKFIRVGLQPVEAGVVRAKLRDGNDFVLDVHDLSARGIGLRSSYVSAQALPVGTVLPAAVLDFRSSGRLQVDLRVVFSRSVQGREGMVNHFGCYYVDLDQARRSLGGLLAP